MLNISDFPWTEVAISENRVLFVRDTLALKRKKRDTGKHRYEFELVTVEMELTYARSILAKISGAVDDIMLFVHPRLSFTQGTEPASKIRASGVSEKGSKLLKLTSVDPWQLMSGDYIQVGNDTKVFQVKNDTLLQVGEQTVELTSALRYQTIAGQNIIANDVTWHLLSDGNIDTGSMSASDNQDMELTLIAVEKI